VLRGHRPDELLDTLHLSLCDSLAAGSHTPLYYTYHHSSRVVQGETCGVGSSSISGIAFTPQSSSFPEEYDGALFFSDYSRACIWAMLAGSNGLPDPNNRQTFVAGAATPVDLQFGPGGDLYYADIVGGAIRRIRSTTTNRAPVARATATPSSGTVPLTVSFDRRASSDPRTRRSPTNGTSTATAPSTTARRRRGRGPTPPRAPTRRGCGSGIPAV
jgi:hypothetical protein